MLHLIAILVAVTVACSAFAQKTHKNPPMPAHKITAAQAQAAAVKKYPGTVVGKVELENEDGKWQYAVNVRSGKKLREIMVDAKSGKIASVEVTSPAEEAKEKAAEEKAKGKHKGG